MHHVVDLKVLYFGTPVVLISTRNENGTSNLAPISSAWWLNQSCLLGLGNSGQTTANLLRERECVLNLPSSALVGAVDRLAMLTGRYPVPPGKAAQGYRYEPDKFSAARLTELPADLVRPARVAECPIQLECVLAAAYPFGSPTPDATAFQVTVVRAYVEDTLIIPGTRYVDPMGWDPLIMKFCEFFGGGQNLQPSRLAAGWQMPHQLPAVSS